MDQHVVRVPPREQIKSLDFCLVMGQFKLIQQ